MAHAAVDLKPLSIDPILPLPRTRRKSSTATIMPSLTTTYLLPAILLNPAIVLHLVNTFISHLTTPLRAAIQSTSPHPLMESLGPLPPASPHLDMHADDALCWRYTAVMVVVQLLAFGRVQDNRVRRRERRALRKAKLEREGERATIAERQVEEEKGTREAAAASRGCRTNVARETNGVAHSGALRNVVSGVSPGEDGNENPNICEVFPAPAHGVCRITETHAKLRDDQLSDIDDNTSDSSLTATSEEEMMI